MASAEGFVRFGKKLITNQIINNIKKQNDETKTEFSYSAAHGDSHDGDEPNEVVGAM